MIGNLLVGLVFASILFLAIRKTYNDIKYNKCSCGCGASCTDKSKCGRYL